MNPINDKKSQNSLVLKAKENVETTTASEAANTSINADIKTNDEIKDINTVDKSEDSSKLEHENQVEKKKKDGEKLPEKIIKSKETNSKDNTKQTSTVKNNKDENKQTYETDDKHSLKAKDVVSLQVEMDNISKDRTEADVNCTVSKKVKKTDQNEQIGSEEKANNNTDLLDAYDKIIKVKNENVGIENESESEKADELDEEYEDVEIPEDEIEELIVPDEADAEDLTSLNGDVLDKSSNEDETTKDSDAEEQDENETSVNEEETTKESEAANHNVKKTSVNKEKLKDSNDDEVEDLTENTEDGEIDNLAIEPELVAIEEEESKDRASMAEFTTNDDDVNNEESTSNTTNDPLNCLGNQEQKDDNDENQSTLETIAANDAADESDNHNFNRNDNDNDDDEDDVQFVETRNSPICIESDEDDPDADSIDKSEGMHNSTITTNPKTKKQTITTPTATITVPKNIIVTRTSARKSTAKPPQQQPAKANNSKTVSQIQNKAKHFSYLEKATYRRSPAPPTQHVVDCIELLDSSDEESFSASHYRPEAHQSRTPQKRTLLAAKGSHNKYSNKNDNTRGHIPSNFTPQIRKQAKPVPLPLPPATPQSNFLNAVQLQPAAVLGVNPPAFSALLSNKSVIIPNAFYGNHPSVRDTSITEMDRRYARWLDNFLSQFCNSQLVATHSCFVYLQKSLKYKDFVRIKAIRANMNTHAQTIGEQLNRNLMADLRTILMKTNRDLTAQGRRFCELTCNSPIQGKAVTLLAHGSSGRVTMKTCHMDIPKATQSSSSTSASSTAANTSLTRKRQLEEDEDEYMPDKQKLKTIAHKPPSENGDSGETSEDRKRSLRTKRTKRLDNSFSYNEDDLLAEYEIDDEEEAEKMAQAEIQRKIENKRLEAQKQRQQQVKSFESAFIQAFAKTTDGPTSSSSKSSKNASNQRIRLKNSTTATSIRQYTANNDAEDLLQATWIENAENDDTQVISDDDEPKVHRIYKQQQQKQYQQQLQQQQQYQTTTKLPTKFTATPISKLGKHYKSQQEEVITGDDDYIENDQFYNNPPEAERKNWPKNVDLEMHVNGKFKDKCVICYLNCQRIVHHYVNEHRGCEVYNSRLTSSQIQLLRNGNCSNSNMSMYKNGQPQYEAYCIFCQKQSRFMLPYWFQHFTMHTGEYGYRCTGCGIRKPTRSLLTQHQSQGCPQNGGIKQDYSHDPKSVQVEARVCKLCNYVQLHRSNIVKHLHQQHNVQRILPKHIQTIVLLKTPSSTSTTSLPLPSPSTTSVNIASKRKKPPTLYNQASSSSSSSPSTHSTYVIEDDDNDFALEQEEPSAYSSSSPTGDTQNHYYNYIPPYMQAGNAAAAAAAAAANFTWEDNDPAEDLSFMICGMLDVQMNNSE